ncbi:MAG: hypothetical protein JWO40_781 [Candidatus Doudnabacteria bacterium]|nr:hypothetical protein [Candidatus Doudnabacteria bacterium]
MSESIEKQKLEIEVAEKELKLKDFFANFSKFNRRAFFVLIILLIPIYFVAKFAVAEVYLNGFSKNEITAHQAIVQALPVQIVETKALTMVGDNYSAYALIKNPNQDLSTKELKYKFIFLDAAGKELGSDSDKTYLLGGEQKYLILPNIHLKQQPDQVQVEITDPVWKRRFSIPNILIKAGIPQYQDQTDPIGFTLQSNISNQSNSTIGAVRISAVVFDKNNKIIGVNQRTENTLAPKEVRDYKMFWPIPLATQVSGTPRIIIETNVLDPENIK